MPIESAIAAAMKTDGFESGECWTILSFRPRVAKRFLSETNEYLLINRAQRLSLPPLHHDKREKVYTLRSEQQLVVQAGPIAEPEYKT